ncbi:MAG: hypothetical protein ACRCX8_00175 [Sarcina sp.]
MISCKIKNELIEIFNRNTMATYNQILFKLEKKYKRLSQLEIRAIYKNWRKFYISNTNIKEVLEDKEFAIMKSLKAKEYTHWEDIVLALEMRRAGFKCKEIVERTGIRETRLRNLFRDAWMFGTLEDKYYKQKRGV